MTKNILIINPFGIGDVLFSTPLVSAMKERSHGSYIGYICNIRTKEILETNPDISEIFVFERDEYRMLWEGSKIQCIKKLFNFWKNIRKRRFDVVIDLSLGKEYAFFCWSAGIKERRGFNYKGRGRFLTHRIPFNGFNDRPVAEYYLDLIGSRPERAKSKIILVTRDSDEAYIDNFLGKAGVKAGDILIGIAPGGGASYGKEKARYKRWGYEKFALVADRIISYGAKPILIGGPEERELINSVGLKTKYKPIITPDMRIRETTCLIKRCKVFICNDGGLLHIAVSQKVPTVSIFGPTDKRVYGPYPGGKEHIVVKSDIDCSPCYKRFKLPKCDTKKCLEDISIEEVFNAFLDLRKSQ
ncbi:glycosyltransferase family 9 protein [Candidatus Omnitrophota bacterium]